MLQAILYAALRSALAYILLLIMVRLMGRKSISQMTFFNLASIITMGAITANIAVGTNRTPPSTVTALIVFGLLSIITANLYIKSFNFRKLVSSEAVTAIKNGKIVEENLGKVRVTIDDLMKMLREKNMFNVADVEFAIIENDGELSVLPKSQKQPITPSDLHISTGYVGLTKDVIMDGRVMYENLQDAGLDEQWLLKQLEDQGIITSEEVFYAGLDTSGKLYVSRKSKDREKHGQYGIE